MANVIKNAPLFHVYGIKGWINDPNGLIKYKDEYHVFYQYHPYSTSWGPMHWGHQVSKDLMHWRELSIALTPGGIGDKDGCFSGSSIIHDGKLYLMYTGFNENGGGDAIRQVQCLASSSDGINFTKHGIVIDSSLLPEGYLKTDFRDPYIIKQNDTYYVLIAAKTNNNKGRILMYKSNNLFDWTFVSDILDKDSLGSMIECPTYNDELGLLIYSEQFQPQEGIIHKNIHTQRYLIGKIDFETGKFKEINRGIVDYGFDFYAPQIFNDDKKMIAWMSMWDRNYPTSKYGYTGMLTLARDIDVLDNELVQKPIFKGELVQQGNIDTMLVGKLKYGKLSLYIQELKNFSIEFRKGNDCYTSFKLINDEWVFDRSHSGEQITGAEKDDDSLSSIRRMPLKKVTNHQIDIILDEFSAEIFVDNFSLTALIYPKDNSDKFIITSDAKCCSYKLYEMKGGTIYE